MNETDYPEFRMIPALVERLIDWLDPEIIVEVDINELTSSILNFAFSTLEVKIDNFEITMAEMPIPGYRPGVFPKRFIPVRSLLELITVSPLLLCTEFTISHEKLSKINAKGLGILNIYRENDKIKVEARDVWHIEEVFEAEPQEEAETLAQKLEKFIKDILLRFVIILLSELATKVLGALLKK